MVDAAPSPLPLYQSALKGDVEAFAQVAFAWLGQQLRFDAGMLVTTFPERPAFLDAHFTGFADVAALMASWREVAHLDILAPDLLAQPGQARCHDMVDPRIAGPEFLPLREHLERFAFRRSLCIALGHEERAQATVLILVRHALDDPGTPAECARLAQLAPAVAEAYDACRKMALLRHPAHSALGLSAARVDREGAFVQVTPAFAEAMWAGAPPQQVHLEPLAFRALRAGRPWPLPGGDLALHAQADGTGWLLQLRRRSAADALTARERQVAQLFARGASCPAIARQLSLAPATVRNHMSNVYAKLAVSHRAALIDALG